MEKQLFSGRGRGRFSTEARPVGSDHELPGRNHDRTVEIRVRRKVDLRHQLDDRPEFAAQRMSDRIADKAFLELRYLAEEIVVADQLNFASRLQAVFVEDVQHADRHVIRERDDRRVAFEFLQEHLAVFAAAEDLEVEVVAGRNRETEVFPAETAQLGRIAERFVTMFRSGQIRHTDRHRLAEPALHQELQRPAESGAVVEEHLMPRTEHEFVVAEKDHFAGEIPQCIRRDLPVSGFGDDIIETAQLHFEQRTIFDLRQLLAVELDRQTGIFEDLPEQRPRIPAQNAVERRNLMIQRFEVEKTDAAVRRQSHIAAHEAAGAAHPADQFQVGQVLQRPVDGFLGNPVAGSKFRRAGQFHACGQLAADDMSLERLHDILAPIFPPGFLGFDFRRLHHHRIPVRLRPPAVNSVCQHAIIMTDSGRKNKCRGQQNCPAVDNHTELVDNFPANTVSGNPGSVTVVLRRKGTPCPFRSLLFRVETA